MVDKRVDVGVLVYNLAYGLACAMPGLAVDSDELGSVAGVGSLKGGSVFERVRGYHAVVVVGGGYENCGVGSAVVTDVVEGRVRGKAVAGGLLPDVLSSSSP